jgi:Rrf2 family transcriptional regulator, iron-sulfur cluster assembly transcription factor
VELNTKGRYAVMAMADLAKAGTGASLPPDEAVDPAQASVPLSAIAERQHISLAYLEQLFARLRRAGLVESARGRTGGYRLARPPSSITIAEIMRAVEEDVRMTRCGGEHGTPCLPGERCLTHSLWDALGSHITAFLEGVTLQTVVDGGPRAVRAQPAALFSGGVLGR